MCITNRIINYVLQMILQWRNKKDLRSNEMQRCDSDFVDYNIYYDEEKTKIIIFDLRGKTLPKNNNKK